MLVPLLLAVAVLGYLVGVHRVSTSGEQAPEGGLRVASGVNVLLEYPSSWEQAPYAIPLPALELGQHGLNLIPRGQVSGAGLISGVLTLHGASPLPAALLAAQHGVPSTEVVNLVTVQAFRYRHLILPGFSGTIDLYVVPTPNDGATVLACYAQPELKSYLTKCEQIVASLTLVGQSTSDLTPDTNYARKLSGLIDKLDQERTDLRRKLSRGVSPAALAAVAGSLSSSFSATSQALATLEPPTVVGPAQVGLARSLQSAGVAYRALASSAQADGSRAGSQHARQQVQEAESSVDAALESFALLGYSHA